MRAVAGKAVTYAGRGGYDVIGTAERNVRAPKVGEVRIRVLAAAVNPTDILLRDPGLGDLDPPMTPGMDGAGIVDAVGSEITNSRSVRGGDGWRNTDAPRRWSASDLHRGSIDLSGS